MHKQVLTAAIATLSIASAAHAQGQATAADRAFLTQDVQGGRYELALAKLATSKAGDPDVRSYSMMVVRDHTTANAALEQLAKSEGVAVPAGLKGEDEKRLADFRGMKGPDFDKAYVKEQNRINTEDARDADKEKASTKSPRIKAYIARFAAMDARHKGGAEKLMAKEHG